MRMGDDTYNTGHDIPDRALGFAHPWGSYRRQTASALQLKSNMIFQHMPSSEKIACTSAHAEATETMELHVFPHELLSFRREHEWPKMKECKTMARWHQHWGLQETTARCLLPVLRTDFGKNVTQQRQKRESRTRSERPAAKLDVKTAPA